MLHPSSIVQWMDVKSQKVFIDPISKMFQMYSHKATRTLDISEVLFNSKSEIVKITDMYGWTDVKALRRIDSIGAEWVGMAAANHQIKLRRDTIIPIYNPKAPFNGFHGETKYPITAKHLYDLEENDIVRIRRGKDENNEELEFSNISFSGIIWNFKEFDFNYAYTIITKSGFFNGNNIHLFGKEFISES